jgi:tetratricopeptide (TPR) repeat protein
VDDLHPSQSLLAGYFRDELPSLRRRKISRHVDLCPVCQRRLSQLEREAEQETLDYEAAFLRVTETLRSLKEGVEEEARRSASLLLELLQESPERRLERIAGEPRFHAVKLCQLLQDRSRADWFQEPARSLESARLAVAVADHLNEVRYGSGLVAEARARAWAHLGNSLRINCRLMDAEQALGKAAEHQRLSGDPLAESEILGFMASLRYQQGRIEETLLLLDKAFGISREIGDRLREGRALILKGKTLGEDFDDQHLPREWAEVSLDLASLLFSQGQSAESRRVVEEVIPVLDHLSMEREATAARKLYLRLPLAKPS